MQNLKIFGHKNPDLDSISSTFALAHFLELRDGIKAEKVRLGEFNKETKFVINKFGFDVNLPIISKLEDGENVALVDHNEFSQTVENISNAKIKLVVDHHKIDNFKTAEPLEYIARPIGSTSTILYELLKGINGLDNTMVNTFLFSAILSDTLIFKSPTTTEVDIKVGRELAQILNLDPEVYGLELLKAGADLSELSADELIKIDAKEFDCNRTSY